MPVRYVVRGFVKIDVVRVVVAVAGSLGASWWRSRRCARGRRGDRRAMDDGANE
jgi:hypothetical protein